jgi:polyhydroxybutyrate depolymerase
VDTVSLASRRYLLWPTHTHGPAPAVVFLHGTGGVAEWVESETHLAAFATTAGFLLAVPAGLPPHPSRPVGFLSNPPRWNDGSTTPADAHHSTTHDVAFLDDVFADLVSNRGADPHRLYLAGFSNGAGMTFRYAAEGRVSLAAITAVAGHCWIDPVPRSRPVPTLYLIGNRDPLVPVQGGEVRIPWGNRVVRRPPVSHSLSKWALANHCEPAPVSRTSEHGLIVSEYRSSHAHMDMQSVVIPGLGHHWPGGEGQLNPRLGGPKDSPISANEWMWRFFQRHS